MEHSQELCDRIKNYCQKNKIVIDFDYRDELSKKQIIKMLESEDGQNDVENEILENSFDYFNETEDYFLEGELYDEFKDELTEAFEKEYPEENEDWIESEVKQFLREEFRDYLETSLNFDQLYNNTGNINCLIVVYSNYDCTKSFDTMELSEYLSQVYDRVKAGVKKEDFVWEHQNGAYGGSLFCFAFNTDLKTLLSYKQAMRTAKKIKIPKGTQFGFFSSFQGAGSCFEKLTYQDFYIKILEDQRSYSKYDNVDIIADCEQHYTMDEVYGGIRLDEQTLIIK